MLARQWYGYGASGALLYRKFRQQGMPRSRFKVAARGWAWLFVHVLGRGAPRRSSDTLDHALRVLRCGRIGGSVRQRVVFV